MCRLLRENYLEGEKWEFAVRVDKSWIYFCLLATTKKKKSIYYRKRGGKYLEFWFRENKESFVKDFMVTAGLSYNGKFKTRKIGKKIKLTRITFRNMF